MVVSRDTTLLTVFCCKLYVGFEVAAVGMWANFRGLWRDLVHCPKCFTQPERSTYILRRRFPIRLNKLGTGFSKKLKKRSYYYELVENTDVMKKPPLELVLTREVPGVGLRGEKIESNIYSAYRDLLLPKLALYADTPEAQDIMESKQEKEYSSINSKIVEKFLATQAVPITLSAETNWKLEPWHVKFALRKIGILTNDECITIPKEITGPNPDIENKDFLVVLTMNKKDKFLLRCRIYHWSSANPLLNKKVTDIRSPSEPLFPDEKEEIDAIIKYDLEIRKKKMLSGGGVGTRPKKT